MKVFFFCKGGGGGKKGGRGEGEFLVFTLFGYLSLFIQFSIMLSAFSTPGFLLSDFSYLRVSILVFMFRSLSLSPH